MKIIIRIIILVKKKIRSLSVEKFSRIEGSYNYLEIINHDEIYPNSLDNNSSSKQSNKEIKNELLSKEINHNKESIDYDDEDEDGDSEGEKEEEMNNHKIFKKLFFSKIF